ncbi:MAG: hypothetical protein NPIRA03_34120 [Nitrospirales bacterium]|nr:MAG: hypothetical protein NPIRA03_34120 [Nitrospirales bacterium]
MLRQMLAGIEGGVNRSIKKWRVEADDFALSLKSREMRHSVVGNQLLDEGQRWSLQ